MSDGYVDGFVVAVGAKHFALEIFSDTIQLNGLNFLRFKDVADCRNPAPFHEFLYRVMVLRKIKRVGSPNVDISSLKSILKIGGAHFPLTTIHLDLKGKGKGKGKGSIEEGDRSKVCYIGRVISVQNKTVKMRCISPGAQWEPVVEVYPLKLIFRVDFGGGYEDALLLAAEGDGSR